MSRRNPTPRRAAHSLAALLWLSTLAAPLAVVQACSCSWLGGTEDVAEQAIANADVAFIGTVTAAAPVFGLDAIGFGGPNVEYAFDVERASVATKSTIKIQAVDDGGGASCGFTFDVGDRWLVAASNEGGSLRTGLCAGNTSLDGDGRGMAERLSARLSFAPEADDGPLGAVLGYASAIAGAAVGIAAIVVTVLAFRRRSRSA